MKYGKVQSSNSKVSEDRTDNVDNTANLKNADMLHIDSLTSNINVHFPIDITTSQEISSMNQSNCISAKSLQRFQRWKPGLEPKECWINDEVCFTRGTWIYTVVDLFASFTELNVVTAGIASMSGFDFHCLATNCLHLVVKRAFFLNFHTQRMSGLSVKVPYYILLVLMHVAFEMVFFLWDFITLQLFEDVKWN